jgi:hypothetical protein
MNQVDCVFLEDDQLPADVVQKKYSERRHALCCLECGFEFSFDPTVKDSIETPLYALVMHCCKRDGD